LPHISLEEQDRNILQFLWFWICEFPYTNAGVIKKHLTEKREFGKVNTKHKGHGSKRINRNLENTDVSCLG
jgi:hypothetical protein